MIVIVGMRQDEGSEKLGKVEWENENAVEGVVVVEVVVVAVVVDAKNV